MQRRRLPLLNYLLGFALTLLVVSTCFNVQSSSSNSPSLPAGDVSSGETARADRHSLNLAARAGAKYTGLFGASRDAALASYALPANRAAAIASPFAPTITATKSHMLAPGDTQADPGDTLTYTVVITNSGTSDATGVNFSDTIDANTTLVPGSVIASPIARDDSYHTIGNVNISVPVAQGVIANDLNPNGSGTLTVTKVNATAVPGGGSATASTPNGSVTMSSDGSFTYTPNVAFRGPSDSFTYTLDNGTGKTDTATVTVAVNGLIWFVDSAAATAGDGRLNSPFNCLVGTNCFDPAAADVASDNIFVYSGSYTGGLTLLNSQKLIGQGASQSLLTITGLSAPSGINLLPATGGANPTITTSAANTNGVNLTMNNQIWGVTFGNKTGAGIAGSGFGTLTVRDTAISGTGQALSLSTGTLDAIFQSIASTNSAATGISVNAAAGSLSVVGTTSITTPTGTGVSLTNNTGTITFAALNISTSNQAGLVGTDNTNTITATSGAISTGTGTAVNITRGSGTTPLNLTLTSVTAAGGSNGIVLNNTSGSFTVAGDGTGTANGSGGTIANMTGANAAVAGRGVSLTNASNVTLNQVNLHDFSNFAIYGSGVTGFALNFANVSGVNGNNNAGGSEEGSIRFDGLFGSATISNSAISGGFTENLRVNNTSGSLNRITVSSNTFGFVGAASGNDNVVLVASNSATLNVTFQDNTVQGARGQLFQTIANNSSTMDVVVRQNKFQNGQTLVTGGGGISIRGDAIGGAATVTYDVSCNRISGSDTTAFFIAKGNGAGTFSGTINGNVIGQTGVTDSGASNNGDDIFIRAAGSGTMTVLLSNNDIRQYTGTAIHLQNNDGSATMNASLFGNLVTEPGSTAFIGLFVDNGATGTDTSKTNLVVGSFTDATKKNDLSAGDPFDFLDVELANFSATTQLNLSRNGSPSSDPATIISDDNLNGAATATDTSGGSGPITVVNTLPPTPAAVAGCTLPAMASRPVLNSVAGVADGSSDANDSASDSTSATMSAARGKNPNEKDVAKLTQADLETMGRAAIEKWREAGIAAEDLARLEAVTFEVAHLRNGKLASISDHSIKVDETAAGYGWYSDPLPYDDREFDVPVPGRERQATQYSPAFDQIDLLTVLVRELGVVYLQGKDHVPGSLKPLMQPTLSPGVRRLPGMNTVEVSTSSAPPNSNGKVAVAAPPSKADASTTPTPAVFNPGSELLPGSYGRSAKRMAYAAGARRVAAFRPAPLSGETVALSVGTIPAGESVTIMFQVTINNPLPSGVCTITNVGHVTGDNFSPVDTNSDVTSITKPLTIGACPANIVKDNDPGVCTAVATFATPTADGCPVPTVTCSPASGFAFPAGTTTVTCTASNGVSPDASCSFTVTVRDTEAPVCQLPSNITKNNDAGQCSAVVTYTATATDNCGSATITCNPASGSTFAVGTTTVNCTASDDSPDSPDSTCSFTVTVKDTEAPVCHLPADITTNNTPGQCSAAVTYTATATDNCSGATISCTPPSGSTFSVGTTTVNCTASDASSDSPDTHCSFTVTVKDTQAPTIGACPANISVTSGGGCQTVNYTPPTATDNCGSATVVCSPASGTCFPAGTTTVTCTASDTSPDSPDASCSFTVTVVPCAISCPSNITVSNDPNQCGALVSFAPTTTGGCGTVVCSPASGSFFPVGTTTVTCTTQVGPSCSFTVTVNDTQGPTITVTSGTIELWPVDHSYHAFTMSDLVASATDNCSGNVFNNVVITSVSSDEPEEVAGGGDGNTLNDIIIAADCKSVQLRAERQGGGNGRVYTINLKVTDSFGNVGTAVRTVVAPQSHGGTAILGPGPGYTVTSNCP